jgi:periplasmic divalent cation tolerance protein
MKESPLLVYCTVPDISSAKNIAGLIVSKRLAACCNIVTKLESIYRWEGKINSATEYLLLIKTTVKRYEQLEKEIKMIHPYTVPEIIATQIKYASQAYLDWIIENVE